MQDPADALEIYVWLVVTLAALHELICRLCPAGGEGAGRLAAPFKRARLAAVAQPVVWQAHLAV